MVKSRVQEYMLVKQLDYLGMDTLDLKNIEQLVICETPPLPIVKSRI